MCVCEFEVAFKSLSRRFVVGASCLWEGKQLRYLLIQLMRLRFSLQPRILVCLSVEQVIGVSDTYRRSSNCRGRAKKRGGDSDCDDSSSRRCAGVVNELCERLVTDGVAVRDRRETGHAVRVSKEGVAAEKAAEG